MMPTIYIAGSSRDLPRAKAAMHAAVGAGYRVLLDWTAAIEVEMAKGRRDRDLSIEEQSRYAEDDLRAAVRADVFWLLVPREDAPSVGCWVELGAALMTRRIHRGLYGEQLVVASDPAGEPAKFSIFTSLSDRRFTSDADAVQFLAALPVQRAAAFELAQRNARGYEWVVPYEAPPAASD